MTKLKTVLLSSAFLAVLIAGDSIAAGATRKLPNIVLLMADDLGWGDVGFNGNQVIATPHLDAMAKAGLRFERFYAAAPVCSPTRGSCLTGRHPYRYGVFFANTGHMRSDELTLAELLQEHGYTTGHFGKWHLGTLTKTEQDANRGGPRGVKHFAPPEQNGFDVNFSTESKVPTWDPMLRPLGERSKNWWDPVADASQAQSYGTAYWSRGKRVSDNLRGDDSRVIADRAVEFITQAAAAKKPFFAVVWFHAPHLPVVAGPQFAAMYDKHDKYTQHYYGCITALDLQVGRLREKLRELGVADNTLLCFCSDNGPEGRAGKAPGSAAHLRGRKRDLFEGGVRVPGLIEWPATIKPGSVTHIPACTSDYLPTIVDLIGAQTIDDRPLDGVSLAPLFRGQMKSRPRGIAFESNGQLALIENQFKIIFTPRGKGKRNLLQQERTEQLPFLLFDLVADPGESRDVAAEHGEVVARMAKTLAAWRQSCSASLAGEDYRDQ